MKRRADQLLEHVCAGGNDSAAYELLNEFFDGYPIERLRRLLRSNEEKAVEAGAWIASELADSISPLMSDLSRLFEHPSAYVRFFILDAVLDGATQEHGDALARAAHLIRDPVKAVRWKALCFFSKATSDQLVASMAGLGNSVLAALVAWLLDAASTIKTKEIITRIEDDDSLRRLFAAAAAARLSDRDVVPLEHAAASTDLEVSSFAKQELEGLAQRRSR